MQYFARHIFCWLAELEEVVAEAQRVSPQVDTYLADNANNKGHGQKKSGKSTSRSNDIEAQ